MTTIGTRPHHGGPSRTLDAAELAAARAALLATAPSPDRSRELLRIRRQIERLTFRSGRNGA